MLFGLLEGDMLLIIGAVLSLMTMLLFWRVKKNSLQLAESSGKLRTLMHMPYRQVRRSIQGKLGAHKLFLLFLLLVFAVAFFSVAVYAVGSGGSSVSVPALRCADSCFFLMSWSGF